MATQTTPAGVILMKADKVTKGTVRFAEELGNELDSPQLPSVYVPKSTLAALGYKEGDTLGVTLTVNP